MVTLFLVVAAVLIVAVGLNMRREVRKGTELNEAARQELESQRRILERWKREAGRANQ